MWLWTISNADKANALPEDDELNEENEDAPVKVKTSGYALEFDTARKIAQGLGVTLEKIPSVVEVKGEIARLLPVSERAQPLSEHRPLPHQRLK
jgi:hypothetical protein